MNNRQGMNSRLPYNQRAFSPQRMMNTNQNFQPHPFKQQQQPQQNMMRNQPNDNFGQPFFQGNRNDGFGSNHQDSRNEVWARNESNINRNQMRPDNHGNCSNFGFNQNQNPQNAGYNNQPSNFGPNYQQGNFSSNQDFVPNNSNSRFQQTNPPFNRPLDSRAPFQQGGPGPSSFNQSFQRSGPQQNFGDPNRDRRPNMPQNYDPGRERRPVGREHIEQRTNQNRNFGGPQPMQGFTPQSFPNPKPTTSTVTQEGTAPLKPKTEIYPDIGEPTIRPKFEDMFSVRKTSETGSVIYCCRICNVDTLPEKNIVPHRGGKKHKYNLRLIENSLPGKTRRQREKQFRDYVNGVVKEVKPNFDIVISTAKHPLIALEYVIEVLNPNAREPLYVCALCNKTCDPRTIVNHLTSQTHRLTFLIKNFPILATQLQASRRFNEDLPFRIEILNKMATYVDSNFDRCSAFVYEGTDFDDMKADLFENIDRKKHITEEDIPNAQEVFLSGFKLRDEKWESVNPPMQKEVKIYNRVEIPDGVKRKRKVPESVIEEYRSAVSYVTNDLENKLVDYERDPESHPLYKKEWEHFWTRKADELTARGEDPAAHNFNSEWCKFFLVRIRELHKEEIEWKTEQIRKKMGLTLEDLEENASKRSRQDSQTSNSKSEELFSDRKGRFHVSDDEDTMDEDFDEFGPRVPKDVLYVKEKKIFNEFLNTVGIDEKTRPKPPPIEKPQQQQETSTSVEPTNLITTCRLLSSFEQELGLLAPKVLELLSKAIGFERETSNSADDLLFDSENLNLVETVKEKLIGMLMAQLIASNRVKAIEKAVKGLTQLIEQHEMMVSIKKTLKEMGKDNASPEEIEMLKGMFKQKQGGPLSDVIKTKKKTRT